MKFAFIEEHLRSYPIKTVCSVLEVSRSGSRFRNQRMGYLMKLADIQIRDPFILPIKATGEYFLFGTTDQDCWDGPGVGFDTYRSLDLIEWDGPIAAFRAGPEFWARKQFWAPEVNLYRGRYYMFASFKVDGRCRGTQVLVADKPDGPYSPWSQGPVTPSTAEALDGTLYVDLKGVPWMVFCHEWIQVGDGRMQAIQLSPDLRHSEGEPITLFSASSAPWARRLKGKDPQKTEGANAMNLSRGSWVTDGPFLYRTVNGSLLMLWSSVGEQGYAMGIARSVSGNILGPWTHDPQPLWARDGGHGMFFRAFDGTLYVTLHQPNKTPNERALLHPLKELNDSVHLTGIPVS